MCEKASSRTEALQTVARGHRSERCVNKLSAQLSKCRSISSRAVNVGQSSFEKKNFLKLEVIHNSCCEFFMRNFFPTLLSLLIIYVRCWLPSDCRLFPSQPRDDASLRKNNGPFAFVLWQSMMREGKLRNNRWITISCDGWSGGVRGEIELSVKAAICVLFMDRNCPSFDFISVSKLSTL